MARKYSGPCPCDAGVGRDPLLPRDASQIETLGFLGMAFRPCNRAIAPWGFVNELQRRDTGAE